MGINMQDKIQISNNFFYDTFITYLEFNIINLIYIIYKFIRNRKILSNKIVYILVYLIAIIPIAGIFIGSLGKSWIDYNDPYLAEGIGWLFVLKIIPIIISATIINFIVLKTFINMVLVKNKDIKVEI